MNHTYKVHTEEQGKSMAMRLLIHYVGDIHQPLHCSTLVNDKYPAGDRGGNSFKLPSADQRELHAVWDSVALEFANAGYAKLPFSDKDWNENGDIADRLKKTYDVDDKQVKDLDIMDWAADDFKITTDFLYKDIKENEMLPEAYIKQGVSISEK